MLSVLPLVPDTIKFLPAAPVAVPVAAPAAVPVVAPAVGAEVVAAVPAEVADADRGLFPEVVCKFQKGSFTGALF